MNSEGAGVRELRARPSRQGIRRIRLIQGDAFALGRARVDGAVAAPRGHPRPASLIDGRAINGTSIVLAVSLGRQRILLTGDLEDDHDADLLEAIPRDGRRWDLLKVAHHGSATASSRPLLEVLRPRLAAISSGSGNRYGHPAPATLERLDGDRAPRSGAPTARARSRSTFDGRPRSAHGAAGGPGRRPACPTRSRPAHAGATSPRRPLLRSTRWRYPPEPKRSHCSCLTSPSPRLLQHMTVVAEVASFLAYRASRAGLTVDRRLVETAALLHDVDKALPRDHPLRELGHGRGRRGLAHAKPGIPSWRGRSSPTRSRASTSPTPTTWVTDGTHRRAHRHLRRQARHPARRLARAAFRALAPQASRSTEPSSTVPTSWRCASRTRSATAIGIEPTDVERLRWVDDAMARAFAAGVPDARPLESVDGLPVYGTPADPSAA